MIPFRVLLRPTVVLLPSAALAGGVLAAASPVLAEPADETARSSAAGLSSVTATSAARGGWTGNLILNPGAEKTKGDLNSIYDAVNLKHWKQTQSFSARKYAPPVADPGANSYELARNSPGAAGGGHKYFVGSPVADNTITGKATQRGTLKKYRNLIKVGARFSFAGWLGGISEKLDRMKPTVLWFNAKGKQVGQKTGLRPVTLADRLDAGTPGDATTMLIKRTDTGRVPKAAREFKITLTAIRDTYVSGAYADKLSLRLQKR